MKKNKQKKVNGKLKLMVDQYKKLSDGLKFQKHSIKLHTDLGRALLSTLPCVALGVAMPQEASGQVMTRAVNIIHTENAMPNTFVDIDVDGGGVNDFVLRVNGGGIGAGNSGGQKLYLLESAANTWWSRLETNDTFKPVGKFKTLQGQATNLITFIGYNSSPWRVDDGIGFLGFKFELDPAGNPGVFHLGWLALDVNYAGEGGVKSINIIKAGWETNAGAASITAPAHPALPVELTSFRITLKGNTSHLNWQTASETNNAGFEIERSEDGKTFRFIAWVEGHGTTFEQQEYLFDDKDLRAGRTYYYRLKQVDFDSKFDYSKIVSVTLKDGQDVVSEFYPNPASKGFTSIQINTKKGGKWTAHIFDVAGKSIRSEQRFLQGGNEKWQLETAGLPQGIYFVKFGNDREQYYRKLKVVNF